MLKLYMNKILIIFFLILSSLSASEPMIVMLEGVYNNKFQKFSYYNKTFFCKAYGVLSLEDVAMKNKDNQTCVDAIISLYRNNPNLKYYSLGILKNKQRYRVEMKSDGSCLLYARGKSTLSELLLENGLALLKPNFRDKELKYRFKKAQLRAKITDKAIWSQKIKMKCLSFFED